MRRFLLAICVLVFSLSLGGVQLARDVIWAQTRDMASVRYGASEQTATHFADCATPHVVRTLQRMDCWEWYWSTDDIDACAYNQTTRDKLLNVFLKRGYDACIELAEILTNVEELDLKNVLPSQ